MGKVRTQVTVKDPKRAKYFERLIADRVGVGSGDVRVYFNSEMHSNYIDGRKMRNDVLAKLLISGSKKGTIPGRFFFPEYLPSREDKVNEIFRYYFDMRRHMSLEERLEWCGEEVREDIIRWVKAGNVRPDNSESYLKKKNAKGYGSTPFIATGDLLNALEVEVNVRRED